MWKSILMAFAVCGMFVCSAGARTARIEGAEVRLLEVGDQAPDFKLFGVDYRYHSIRDYRDQQVVVVIFHCNHCPISQGNRGSLVGLAERFLGPDVQILAINPNPADKVAADGFEQMREVAQQQGYEFPYLYDETQLVAAAYGARRTDHVFVLGQADDDGARRVEFIGPLTSRNRQQKYTADAVEALLGGMEIEEAEIEAFGCTIKYRNAEEREQRGVEF